MLHILFLLFQRYEKNSRGMEIFVKSWVPVNKRPKGLIFLCHGYGDTVTFFFEGAHQKFEEPMQSCWIEL